MLKNKIQEIRSYFDDLSIDAYIIPSTDEFLSEYPPAFLKRMEYILSFSCSNGILIILRNKILFITDSRYLTVAKEYENDEFQVYNYRDISKLNEHQFFQYNPIIGYNEKLFNQRLKSFFDKLNLKNIEEDIISKVWDDRPEAPCTDIFSYEEYAGESSHDKLNKIRKFIKDKNADGLLITSPESLCWLLNIRAKDTEYSPIILGYLYVDFDRVILFSNPRNFQDIQIKEFNEHRKFLKEFNAKILIPRNSNLETINLLDSDKRILCEDPITEFKAIKNKEEITSFKEIHKLDAVALISFYNWLDKSKVKYTEYELGIELAEFRARSNKFIMESFAPICGFRENGAKMHYRADENNSNIIDKNGLLLIDSGGHYFGGTTDVTRTTLIGSPKKEYINYYTRVLKGHIAVANIKFPNNITGASLDPLARSALWEIGEDFGHSTGHGVGNALSVHEGPMALSPMSKNVTLKEGMILSNEPGYYLEGEFGIRIENLQYVKKSSKNGFLEFEQLTLLPYENSLIDFSMISEKEMSYIGIYYSKIISELSDMLDYQDRKYLESKLKLN